MTKLATFNQERTYGIEIEAFGVSDYTLAKALTDAGIKAEVEGYNHQTNSHWKIVTDGSLANDDGSSSDCFELVSPPLKGIEGLEEIRKVCAVLDALNIKVNKTCGLHVHHDASDFSFREFRNLVALYATMENTIDAAMPASRRANGNRYCRSIAARMEICRGMFDACKTVEHLQETFLQCDRYWKLNLKAYWRHGTVEFRQHSGTVDAEKIVNWVVFTQLMVNKAVTSRRKITVNTNRRYTDKRAWYAVAVGLGVHGYWSQCDEVVRAAVAHMASRIDHFNQLNTAAA